MKNRYRQPTSRLYDRRRQGRHRGGLAYQPGGIIRRRITDLCQNPKRAKPALFAIPLAVILGALSHLHGYWALGGRWDSAYVVPVVKGQRSFNPTPHATWLSVDSLQSR